MIHITEADLLRMREVQAKYTKNRSDFNAMGPFVIEAMRDWPRLIEWALEARRVLEDFVHVYECGGLGEHGKARLAPRIAEARRLVGER